MDIIDRLEQFRLENKITQQELAEKLEVAFSTVNRWLNRKSEPNKIQNYHIKKLISEKKVALKQPLSHKNHSRYAYNT